MVQVLLSVCSVCVCVCVCVCISWSIFVLVEPLLLALYATGPLFCLSCLSVCNVGLLWPNGCVDQDATWNGGRPWPRRHCVTWGPSSRQERDRVALHFLPMSLRPMSIVAKRSPISATAELLFVTAFVTDLYRQCWAYHGCVQFRPVYRYDTLMTLYSYIYGRPM